MLRRVVPRLSATAAANTLQLVECPRDAMQGLRDFVPTQQKIRYINQLLKVGFHTLDCGSFVSAPAVPQMRDTAEVLAGLDLSATNTKLLVVVCNLKGAVKAAMTPCVRYLGYPLSVSETFQKKNTNRDIATALRDLEQVQATCAKHTKELVTYISMGFGNPYGEEYRVERVEELVEKVAAMGVRTISLADTIGVSEPGLITRLFSTLIPRYPHVRFGAHFHSGTVSSEEKVRAAVAAGCMRFDGAIGGMGGCPFAKSTLVGNIATEGVVKTLTRLNIPHGLNLTELAKCGDIKHEIFGVAVKELLLAQVLRDEPAFQRLCQAHFNRHDAQKLGYLELPEFGNSMRQVFEELGSAPPTEERIRELFKATDLSGNGAITLDEYTLGARIELQKRWRELEAEEGQIVPPAPDESPTKKETAASA